jgi:hypothetical protein
VNGKTILAALLLTTFILIVSAGDVHARGATIASCDASGKSKDFFNLNETMYVMGGGYAGSSFGISSLRIYNVYVVKDVFLWKDKMPIPKRIPGTVQRIFPDSSGKISPTPVWTAPLTTGPYDIVVDVNGNGRYDVGIDALDDNSVQECPVQHYGVLVVPEYWLGPVLGLTGCFAAFGAFRLVKRKQ